MSDTEVPGLEDFLRALRRRWKIAVVVFLLSMLISGLYLSTRSEFFTASTRVLVGPTPVGSTVQGRLVAPVLERERQVLASLEVAEGASERLSSATDPTELLSDLDVTFQPDTDTLVVRFTGPDPAMAAAVADAFALEYVERREAEEAVFYDSQLQAAERLVVETETEIAALEDEIAQLGTERGALLEAGLTTASGQITNIDNRLASLRTSLAQAEAARRPRLVDQSEIESSRASAAPTAEFLAPASIPSAPDGLSASIVRALGALIGLGLGVSAAFVVDRLDSRMRDRFELERSLGSPVLGSIPSMGMKVRFSGHSLVMADERGGVGFVRVREAFRRLRSSVGFLQMNDGPRAFIVTSARPGEGKTTVAANLAVSLAQSGRSVALVSGDMRRPRLDELFGVSGEPGLSELLNGVDEVELLEGGVDGLRILPSGATPGNPAELLSSERAKLVIESIQSKFDVVLIDTPPVLMTADAMTLAAQQIPVLLVVDGRKTEAEALSIVRTELEKVGSVVSGSILNRDPSERRPLLPLGRRSAYYSYAAK